MRIRNCTGARVLVVTSVDGVNVISGDTASPNQSGYVLEPWGSVEIAGWRKSMERTAAFYFTDLGDSYAARTGRPQNVGVIGVAVFQESEAHRVPRAGPAQPPGRGRIGHRPAFAQERTRRRAGRAAGARASRGRARRHALPTTMRTGQEPQAKTLGKLGTGHGRNEESRVTLTQFERATSYAGGDGRRSSTTAART